MGTMGVEMNPSTGRDPVPTSLCGYGSSVCELLRITDGLDGTEDADAISPSIAWRSCASVCLTDSTGEVHLTLSEGIITLLLRIVRSGDPLRNSAQGVALAAICCSGGGGSIECPMLVVVVVVVVVVPRAGALESGTPTWTGRSGELPRRGALEGVGPMLCHLAFTFAALPPPDAWGYFACELCEGSVALLLRGGDAAPLN